MIILIDGDVEHHFFTMLVHHGSSKLQKLRMTLSATIKRSTGFLSQSVREDLATGLRTFRTGVSLVTDTGEHLLISGSVMTAAISFQ